MDCLAGGIPAQPIKEINVEWGAKKRYGDPAEPWPGEQAPVVGAGGGHGPQKFTWDPIKCGSAQVR